MSIDPKALEAARRIEKGFAAGMNYQEPMSMCDDALLVARALLAGEGAVPPKEWDGRSVGESAPHAAYCDLAMADAMIQIKDGDELVWSYDDALFDRALAANGWKVVPVDFPSPSPAVRDGKLREALETIGRRTDPGNRTFDEMIRDMGLANDLARAALRPQENKQ